MNRCQLGCMVSGTFLLLIYYPRSVADEWACHFCEDSRLWTG